MKLAALVRELLAGGALALFAGTERAEVFACFGRRGVLCALMTVCYSQGEALERTSLKVMRLGWSSPALTSKKTCATALKRSLRGRCGGRTFAYWSAMVE